MTDDQRGEPTGSAPEADPTAPGHKPTAGDLAQAQSATGQALDHWDVSVERIDGFSTLNFLWKGEARPQPPGMLDLLNRIERTMCTLKIVYGKERKPQYEADFRALHGLAQVGLDEPRPEPLIASAQLDMLQWDVLRREGRRSRSAYVRYMGWWALGFAVLWTVLYFLFERWPRLPAPEVYAHRNLLLIYLGCMAGAWASFAGRKVVLTFFDLGAMDDSNLDPPLRLIFVTVLTTILALTFITGFAELEVGGFRASQAMQSGPVAILIGAFCGLSEKALPAAIMQRAGSFISGGRND